MSLLFALILTAAPPKKCAMPLFIDVDLSRLVDATQFKRATLRCPQKYPNSPCVVKFERVGENDFIAICGAKK